MTVQDNATSQVDPPAQEGPNLNAAAVGKDLEATDVGLEASLEGEAAVALTHPEEFVDVMAFNEIGPGEIKAVRLNEAPLVIAYTSMGLKAYDGRCPHKDAPMEQGALCRAAKGEEVLVCPWHRAVFSAKDGALKEPPAFTGLKTYPLKIDQGRILVSSVPMPAPAVPELPERGKDNVLIIGGGAAGAAACDELRQCGFKGKITMVAQEPLPPYDRTMLSKTALLVANADQIKVPFFLDEKFYEENKIKLIRDRAASISPTSGHVRLASGKQVYAANTLICTGADAKKLDVPGADLPGVLSLRTRNDAQKVVDLTPPEANVVLVGSGLINLEVASSLRQKGVGVTIISRHGLPLEGRFGREIAGRLKQLHEENGVAFVSDTQLQKILGKERVEGVSMADGMVLRCSCVIIGIGARPAADFADNLPSHGATGLLMVNEDMSLGRIGDVKFFAAGDVSATLSKKYLHHVEHLRHAEAQGRRAARSMLGLKSEALPAPWFWTQQFGKRIEYVGWGRDFDQVSIEGDIRKFSFFCTFIAKGRPVGYASCGAQFGAKMALACVDFKNGALATGL